MVTKKFGSHFENRGKFRKSGPKPLSTKNGPDILKMLIVYEMFAEAMRNERIMYKESF